MAKVITGRVRLCYPKLFTPEMDDNGKLKYSCAILIPKTDTDTYQKLLKAEAEAEAEGKSSKWGGKSRNKPSVIKDGDLSAEDHPERAGHWMMGIASTRKPGVVDANVQPIIDPSEIYPGCWVRVSLGSYPYAYKGVGNGVGFGLNNVQKVAEGEVLGGMTNAEDDFSAIEDDLL